MNIQISPSNNALTLEEIYHPNLVHICSYIQYFALSLATIVTFIGYYIIITQSTAQMGQYKYVILVRTFWFYAFDIVYAISQPIFLFPHLLIYSGGLLKEVSPEVFFFSVVTIGLILGGGAHSFLFAFTFRVAQLFDGSMIENWFKGRKLWIIFMGSYVVFITPLVGRSFLLSIQIDQDQGRYGSDR